MKFPFVSLTRRQAFAGVAAAATTATTAEKELLLKMALTNDHVFCCVDHRNRKRIVASCML